MSNSRKIAIGYPHPGSVRECFMSSLMNFREFDLAHECIMGARIPERGLYIAGVRNKIVSSFLTTPFDWLMMIDTDHQFAPEDPYYLLNAAQEIGAKVISALYFGILDGQVAPMWWSKSSKGDPCTVPNIVPGVQEILGFGAGMCLIHRSVFEEMEKQYQDDPWKWFNHDITTFNGHSERFGEDLGFCNRVTKLGIKMYGDSRVVIGHDKSQIIDLASFLKVARERKEGEPVNERVIDTRV
jgi:hypothetical protein